MWKQFSKAYFIFTLKERKGAVIIVVLIFIWVALQFFYPLFIKNETFSHSKFENEIAKLEVEKNDSANISHKNIITNFMMIIHLKKIKIIKP